MDVCIRTDSSLEIGTGHVMRCLTLAEYLHDQGVEVVFICRKLPGCIVDFIEAKGLRVCLLLQRDAGPIDEPHHSEHEKWLVVGKETDAADTGRILAAGERFPDWLVVDHYALDSQWERSMRPYVGHIMVIDDLADRSHDCDLLLDQNFYENARDRYRNLVPSHCRMLLGPEYGLLRPEFNELRQRMTERDGTVSRILVFFGGSDVTNETAKALEAVSALQRPDIAVDVVIGSSNPHKAQIESAAHRLANVRLHYQTQNMAELMAQADLAIGAGGTTTWERCCLGLPTLAIVVAENQREMTEAADGQGAVLNMGWREEVSEAAIEARMHWLLEHPDALQKMSQNAVRLSGNSDHAVGNPVVAAIMEVSRAVF